MTEELKKKAEEYVIKNVCENCSRCQSKGYIGCDTYRFAKKTYIDSAEENGIEWHDLRKDPNDLPKKVEDEIQLYSDTVWIHINNWGTEEGYYDYSLKSWIVRCRVVYFPVIAWCEIPTFKE